MAMKYPSVRSEEETLAMVLAGRSIARYGDGEFKIAAGNGCVSQIPDKGLTTELREILVKGNPRCIVGIPRLDPRSPKIENWRKYEDKYPKFLSPAVDYFSAFITRPDSAPWIYTKEFYDKIASLWQSEPVILVSGSDRSLTPEFIIQRGANVVRHIICPRRDAYSEIDRIEELIRKECSRMSIKRVLLCCGPTATCLAWRLSNSLHAVDLGHIGMFWFNGEEKPKWMRSRSEKNSDSGGQ